MLGCPRDEDNAYHLHTESEFSASALSGVARVWLHRARETQPESVSIYNPCHTPQNTVSLKHRLCGSSGINGDVDIFRQSVYLILMLSNHSQSPPHGAIEPRSRPRCLAIALVFPFIPQDIEFITMASMLIHVMSSFFLFFLFYHSATYFLPPLDNPIALQVPIGQSWLKVWRIAGGITFGFFSSGSLNKNCLHISVAVSLSDFLCRLFGLDYSLWYTHTHKHAHRVTGPRNGGVCASVFEHILKQFRHI